MAQSGPFGSKGEEQNTNGGMTQRRLKTRGKYIKSCGSIFVIQDIL